ncbi:MAG: hypothetical protein ACRC2T_16475, partial [Thermoguttaceae bacterium]
AELIRSDWKVNLLEFQEAFKYGKFDELAGLVSALDLVITPPGYVANLAAALGVETRLILPYLSDWRWNLGEGKESNQSYWFNKMRVFRQLDGESWQSLINRVTDDLK